MTVHDELEQLAAISEALPPVVTRVVFTNADLRARAFVKDRCREAGLSLREDAVGNTFATWSGSDPSLPAVATGSHIDAIPNAGRYDGTVGVLGGLDAIRRLQREGFVPRRSIELIVFTSEEPTRFGFGCLGSRLMSGVLDESAGTRLVDKDGQSLDAVRSAAGFDGSLASVRVDAGRYAAFVELHIEQGPILERDGIDIGIVTAIAAPATLRVAVDGEGGHAGAVLMPVRRDAFLAAAELALAVESAALGTGSPDSVATVGVCQVFPGAVNSVPSRATIEVDVRDIDAGRRDSMLGAIERAAQAIAKRRKVNITTGLLNADPPAACDTRIVELAGAASASLGLSATRMISRAYHDALFMARVAPTAMIFIPCRGGVSHRPDEYASPDAVDKGVRVLASVLRELVS